MKKSPIDNIIVDMILDHFNMCRMTGNPEVLTETDFDNICKEAENIWLQEIMIKEIGGSA